MKIEQLKYPIGKFKMPDQATNTDRAQWLADIATLPGRLSAMVATLSDEQMDTPYRPDGWTVRQVCHHLADSHMNAFTRIKLTLTEDSPAIKPYDEVAWAKMDDYWDLPVESSLLVLQGLHPRMAYILKNLSETERKMFYVHPGYDNRRFTLEQVMALYAWHGNHHLAHIIKLKERMGWA